MSEKFDTLRDRDDVARLRAIRFPPRERTGLHAELGRELSLIHPDRLTRLAHLVAERPHRVNRAILANLNCHGVTVAHTANPCNP
nr:hypothetical protein [Prescottella equi]